MAIRMQDCRSMCEPCQCPRCRFEMHMSSPLMNCQEKCTPSAKCCNMGGLPKENQPSFDNCQRPCWPKRLVPQEVSQNFHQGNPQKLPQELPPNRNCQPLRKMIYGQHSPGQANQEYRQQIPQQTSQQFSQQSPRKCCYQVPTQNLGQQSPRNYLQRPPGILFQKHPINIYQEDFEDDHYNGMRRRPCYCVTHEMGVQTDETECKSTKDQIQSPTSEEDKDSSVEYIAVTELTTKEVEVKHKTGAKDIYTERIQSVTHFPTGARERIAETPTGKKLQEEKQENTIIKDESKEDNMTPLRTLRQSELESMVESAKAEVPKADSKAETGELLYHQYETFERDFGDTKETVRRSTKKGRSAPGSPASRLSKTRTPTPRSATSRSPTSRSATPRTATPRSATPRSPISLTPSRGTPSSHKSIYRTPREDMSRSESGRDISPPLSPQSSATKSEQNTSIANNDDASSDNWDDKDEVMTPEVPKEEKRLPSEYDNVSTVHVRVTNRKEASVKRPNGKKSNDKITAVFESRVSQVLLKEQGEKKPGGKNPTEKNEQPKHPSEKKPSERKPEEKKPGANKPEKKKSKSFPPPKMEMKQGYPSNDLVCRFANPLKCRPTCRSFRFPCSPSNPFKSFNSFNSFNSFKHCPSRSPSTRQYDPIYGFGSKCIAYYCR
ncbi:neurofilament medium polypeptide isoform X2 [Drosophila subpulchrella]|uniref:neurofilament medium polypeptide isoform X2 n=1 Tax=Drosophila subpulchrella TaxID=1486046 RepID=UPI0018A1881A|nr:neurofilament medium polypeptide isoform X2 [Drosophila subpulchrella]